MRTIVIALCAVLGFAGCRKEDGADMDQAGEDLRAAQTTVHEHAGQVVSNQEAIDKQKRDLATEQQQLADRQKLVEQQRQQLGSAQGTLESARVAYGAAIKERLAKLDAALAELATKTDARSVDALVGLRARRERLALQVVAVPTESSKDLDATFDAIERDLHAAMH